MSSDCGSRCDVRRQETYHLQLSSRNLTRIWKSKCEQKSLAINTRHLRPGSVWWPLSILGNIEFCLNIRWGIPTSQQNDVLPTCHCWKKWLHPTLMLGSERTNVGLIRGRMNSKHSSPSNIVNFWVERFFFNEWHGSYISYICDDHLILI